MTSCSCCPHAGITNVSLCPDSLYSSWQVAGHSDKETNSGAKPHSPQSMAPLGRECFHHSGGTTSPTFLVALWPSRGCRDFIFYMYLFSVLGQGACACHGTFVEVRGQLTGLSFFFSPVGPRDQVPGTRFDGGPLCQQSHLADPR